MENLPLNTTTNISVHDPSFGLEVTVKDPALPTPIASHSQSINQEKQQNVSVHNYTSDIESPDRKMPYMFDPMIYRLRITENTSTDSQKSCSCLSDSPISPFQDSTLLAVCTKYGLVNRAVILQPPKNDGDSSEATNPSPGPRIGIVEFFNKCEAEKCKDFLEQNSYHTIRLTAERKLDPTNLYLTGLPFDYKESQLKELLGEFGAINSVRIIQKGDDKTSIAFARCESVDTADKIIESLNNICLGPQNRPMKVKRANVGKRRNGTLSPSTYFPENTHDLYSSSVRDADESELELQSECDSETMDQANRKNYPRDLLKKNLLKGQNLRSPCRSPSAPPLKSFSPRPEQISEELNGQEHVQQSYQKIHPARNFMRSISCQDYSNLNFNQPAENLQTQEPTQNRMLRNDMMGTNNPVCVTDPNNNIFVGACVNGIPCLIPLRYAKILGLIDQETNPIVENQNLNSSDQGYQQNINQLQMIQPEIYAQQGSSISHVPPSVNMLCNQFQNFHVKNSPK